MNTASQPSATALWSGCSAEVVKFVKVSKLALGDF